MCWLYSLLSCLALRARGVCRPFAGLRATNEDDADFNSKGVNPYTFVLSHSVRADSVQMNKTQSSDGMIGPHHAIRRGAKVTTGCET